MLEVVGSAMAHISAWLSCIVAVTLYELVGETERALGGGVEFGDREGGGEVVAVERKEGGEEVGEVREGGGEAGGDVFQERACGDPGGVVIVDREANPGYAKF